MEEAIALRKEGKTYAQIGEVLGVSQTSAYYFANPDKKADRERTRGPRDAEYRRRNRERRRDADRQRHAKPDAPDAKPTQAPPCKCETPWAVNEVVHENPIVTEVRCLKCARRIV